MWLDVPFELLAARLTQNVTRPLWTSLEETRLRYAVRRADYAQADIRLSVTDAPPHQIAEEIVQALLQYSNREAKA